MKKLLFLILTLPFTFQTKGQAVKCIFKQPVITMDFGTGNVDDLNANELSNYRRVMRSCPTDGHYTYTSYTSDCFRGDWLTLEDHTPGEGAGNMMLVNAAPVSGTFLTTTVNGLKSGTTYEFAVWMMNVCKPTDKCPFPLLPRINIRLQTPAGKTVGQFSTGELSRLQVPHWTQYRAVFTTPLSKSPLTLTMIDNAPGGCGNDFALDDITFRECVKSTPVVKPAPVVRAEAKAPVVAKRQRAAAKPALKKQTASVKRPTAVIQNTKPQPSVPVSVTPVSTQRSPAPPLVLTKRGNPLVKQIEIEAGEIRLDLYDNGDIDGDTVSIYHNNALLVSHAKLSQKPISFRIAVDAVHPHHELIMVAHNLGSIPPNTSLMVVTSGSKRYEVFISSTEQKNAKVVFNLKE